MKLDPRPIRSATLKLAGPITALTRDLGFCTQRALLALDGLQNAAVCPTTLAPEAPSHVLSIGLPERPIADVAAEAESWVLRHVLADYVEYAGRFLDEARKLVIALPLVGRGMREAELRELVARELEGDGHSKFTKKPLEQRIAFLAGAGLNSPHTASLASLQGLRNCIAHRHGRVGAKDVGSNGKLVVTWSQLGMFSILADGEAEPRAMPFTPHPADKLEQRAELVTRTFEEGDEVRVSRTDLSGIYVTLLGFASDMTRCLTVKLETNTSSTLSG